MERGVYLKTPTDFRLNLMRAQPVRLLQILAVKTAERYRTGNGPFPPESLSKGRWDTSERVKEPTLQGREYLDSTRNPELSSQGISWKWRRMEGSTQVLIGQEKWLECSKRSRAHKILPSMNPGAKFLPRRWENPWHLSKIQEIVCSKLTTECGSEPPKAPMRAAHRWPRMVMCACACTLLGSIGQNQQPPKKKSFPVVLTDQREH